MDVNFYGANLIVRGMQMLELPEAMVIARQINESLYGKRIIKVIAANHPHKFAWYFGDPNKYPDLLLNKTIGNAVNYGGLVEIKVGQVRMLFGDGVNLRYYEKDKVLPKKHQLLIEFDDHSHLVATVQMYGGIWIFVDGQNDNPYYLVAKEKPSPLSDDFTEEYFTELINLCKDSLSLKAFLATEQRIPGLGNGVVQDILFNAQLHPKKKLKTLTLANKKALYMSIKSTLNKMQLEGGRDTEHDLYGSLCSYRTILSKNTLGRPCLICKTIIKKETYLGGSIYFCAGCQKQ